MVFEGVFPFWGDLAFVDVLETDGSLVVIDLTFDAFECLEAIVWLLAEINERSDGLFLYLMTHKVMIRIKKTKPIRASIPIIQKSSVESNSVDDKVEVSAESSEQSMRVFVWLHWKQIVFEINLKSLLNGNLFANTIYDRLLDSEEGGH